MNFSCLGNMLAIPGCDMRKENSIFCAWTRTTCFYDLGLSRLGFKHPTSACGANALTICAHAVVSIAGS